MTNPSLGHFDVCLCGTSLRTSILAAALAKAGKAIIHVDDLPYYGAADASLTLHELLEWAHRVQSAGENYTHINYAFPGQADTSRVPAELEQLSRQYALSLAPSLIPAIGPFVENLVRAGVSRYTGFRLLEAVSLCSRTSPPKRVPASKEDVFTAKDLSLPEKRRLMKFLLFAAGQFEDSELYRGRADDTLEEFVRRQFGLDGDTLTAVLYAVALSPVKQGSIGDSFARLRTNLHATGRYGNSPFLVGQYGGAGELAQGYCRAAAVHGSVYMLGRAINYVSNPTRAFTIQVENDSFTADRVVSETSYLSRFGVGQIPCATSVHRCIAILDEPVPCLVPLPKAEEDSSSTATDATRQAEAALFVYPPGEFGCASAPIRALMVGEATFACPEGQYVLYVSTPAENEKQSSQDVLKVALNSLVAYTGKGRVLFELFYTEHASEPTAPLPDGLLSVERTLSDIGENVEVALSEAQRLYRAIMAGEPDAELFPNDGTTMYNDDDD